MPGPLERVLLAPLIWTAVALALWWGHLPAQWRRNLALAVSAAGLVLLMIALNTEGFREAPTTAQFLLSERYVTGYSYASASLPYYVLTAASLLLGFAGLVLPDGAVERMRSHWLAVAIAVSFAVTALRFSLEKVAAPAAWSTAVGITWMPPVVGAFLAHHLRKSGLGLGAVVKPLAVYSITVRAAVALLMVVATTQRLGSHYDLSGWTRVRMPFRHEVMTLVPGSAEQILYLGVIPQLTFNAGMGFLAGLAGAAAYLVARRAWEARHPVPALRPPPIEWEPASQDR